MATDDQEVLAQIRQLAGQINRHKYSKQAPQYEAAPTQYHPSVRGRGAWGAGRASRSGRGYSRGGKPSTHRNRSLVLNGSSIPRIDANANRNDENVRPAGAVDSPSWVTKNDRHLQLINTSVFGEESQRRAKAMEETRKLKLKQREETEKAKLDKHLYRMSGNIGYAAQPQSASLTYEINVEGIQFQVVKNGSKLLKVPGKTPHTATGNGIVACHTEAQLTGLGDSNAAKATPKIATIGGVKFHRSKNGNMFRAGIVKAHRLNGVVKKINEPCNLFSTTGTCSKGPRCRYVHDPSKVAVCKEFLLRSTCPSGDSCDLSHDLTPERTPFCLHFTKGKCSNPQCHYAHIKVSPAALVCRPFGFYGYCDKGSSCEERHVYECPNFSNTGKCTIKGCKLPHRHKASVMRSNTRSPSGDDESDISSDEDQDEIDSDDVDSDDLEGEYMDGEPDMDLLQQDYVQLH